MRGAKKSPAKSNVDWTTAVATTGGGVKSTIDQIRKHRGPNKLPTKQQIAIRLDREVIAAFKASGSGWQTRMNFALKEWLKTNHA